MSFQQAYPDGVAVPRIVTLPLAASQVFNTGALLLKDGDGAAAECAADPDTVGGIALAGAGPDVSGFNILGAKSFPPGYVQVLALDPNVPLSAKYVGTLPAADGGEYGAVRDTDGDWKIDFNETSAVLFKLVDRRTLSPENIARVIVRPLAAAVQLI